MRQLLDGGSGIWMPACDEGRWGAAAAVRAYPERVEALHRGYRRVGAGLLRTLTFSLPSGLARGGTAEEAVGLLNAGIRLARESAGSLPVFVSLGPTGLSAGVEAEQGMSPYALLSSQLSRHRAEGRTSGVILETFRSLTEVELALRGLWAAGPIRPTWVFLSPGQNGRLADGVSLAAAGAALEEAFGAAVGVAVGAASGAAVGAAGEVAMGAEVGERFGNAGVDLVGLGCHSPGVDPGVPLAELARGFAGPLAVSLPAFGDGSVWADQLAAIATGSLGSRLAWIGGCCGTGPAHLQALIARLATGHRAAIEERAE